MAGRAVIKKTSQNMVRIIAGEWRGRKIKFADSEGLRPSKDFIRETLFNWLAPRIAGSRCLDLFTGSGALGFEAVSRGAGKVVMVEKAANVIACLKEQAAVLRADNLDIYHQSAESFLSTAIQPFDIVFLDPPFGLPVMQTVISLLHDRHLVKEDGLIYIETSRKSTLPEIPEKWNILREKQTGQVCYRLLNVLEADKTT